MPRLPLPGAVVRLLLAGVLAAGLRPPAACADDPIAFAATGDGVAIDVERLRVAPAGRPLLLTGLALGPGRTVDLEVERFRVLRPDTALVVRRGGVDVPLALDRDRLVHLAGRVRGEPGSRALVTLGAHRSFAVVERNGRRTVLASRPGGDARVLRPEGAEGAGSGPGGPPCAFAVPTARPVRAEAGTRAAAGAGVEAPDVRVIELAVDTDHEYFQLHGNADAATEYVVQLYAGVSDLYRRDVRARFALTFVRIWEDAADLFNEPDPLAGFRAHWNDRMLLVPRDVAQLLSGRRDLPYGGVAFLGSLCADDAYSVVGYVLGSETDLDAPSVFHYDTIVTAHELGHNCGALHSHDYGVDSCNDFKGVPSRGTIMSYCSQTVSGGNANCDLRFHAVVQDAMLDYLDTADCLALDCNGNGVGDGIDIALGVSLDANANGRPDECEDCNGNGTYDKVDTLTGTSPDVNGNLVPDECEPDCNGNGLPDSHEIATGGAVDANGDRVPDECAPDDDGDGVADHVQIQADMALDLDRDVRLDATEDCDGDGVTDAAARDGAHDAWVAAAGDDALRRFHAVTGTRVATGTTGVLADPADVLVTADRRVLVTSAGDHRVVEFDADGAYVQDLVAAGAGGLAGPASMVLAPDGALLVASTGTDAVLAYDPATGRPLGPRVAPGAGGLEAPFGLAVGPGGELYVTAELPPRILAFDAVTGAFLRVLVDGPGNGGLTSPRGLAVRANGDVLVASFGTNEILAYAGATGASLGRFNQGGTATALTLDQPWCVRARPDGCVYVSRHDVDSESGSLLLPDPLLHLNASRLYCFDAASGRFLRSYVLGNDTGLELPTGFDFLPGDAIDCNRNGVPDACDVAQGTSLDANGDGRPDECPGPCPADLTRDATVGFADLSALLAGWGACRGACAGDLNGDGTVGFRDLATLLTAWGDCPPSP